MSKNKCVQPYTEGLGAWKKSKRLFIFRIRGILGSIAISLLTLGSTPLWLNTLIDPSKTIKVQYVFIISLILLIIIIITSLLLYRRSLLFDLNARNLLHKFSHRIRDIHTSNFKKILNRQRFTSENYDEYLDKLAKQANKLFNHYKGNNTDCCIRLAFSDKELEGNVIYRTKARTDGLHTNRHQYSEDIPANKGIPKYLIEKNDGLGILIYNDIQEAITYNLFVETQNERNFPDDINTMMIAPLNAWDGKKQSMIGIIYITSRKKGIFKEKDVDILRYIADKLSDSIAITTHLYKILN